MASETTKSVLRRLHDGRYFSRYFVGRGIDIGAGSDSLAQHQHFFPGIKSIKSWDIEDGDAQYMLGVEDEEYDFVHSSHCLEHLNDPLEGLSNWIRICKRNGHLIIVVPDEDLYEQQHWPSEFNPDHKWTFTINKKKSWSPKSKNLFQLLSEFTSIVEIKKIELLDATYNYGVRNVDQTRFIADSGIEIIMKKIV